MPNLNKNQFLFQIKMQIIKQLTILIEQTTNQAHTQSPINLYEKVLALINSRVDMPKHTINAISKRLSIKNKKVIYYCFDLLEYFSYRCQLSLYSQISTKQFLLKITGLLVAQDIDKSVFAKILQTVKCWEELFRPYQDLLPMYCQFYAGLLKKELPFQNSYVSPHRPKDFKLIKVSALKKEEQSSEQHSTKQKQKESAAKTQEKTFQQIREKVILTKEQMDNTSSEKEKIKSKFQDIFDTFQEKQTKDPKRQCKKHIDILNSGCVVCEKRKVETSSVNNGLMDLIDVSPNVSPNGQSPSSSSSSNVNIFDLLGNSSNQQDPLAENASNSPNICQQQNYLNNSRNKNSVQAVNANLYQSNNLQGTEISPNPYQSNSFANVNLNSNNFQTQNDFAKYDDRPLHQILTDLDPRDFFKK